MGVAIPNKFKSQKRCVGCHSEQKKMYRKGMAKRYGGRDSEQNQNDKKAGVSRFRTEKNVQKWQWVAIPNRKNHKEGMVVANPNKIQCLNRCGG